MALVPWTKRRLFFRIPFLGLNLPGCSDGTLGESALVGNSVAGPSGGEFPLWCWGALGWGALMGNFALVW